MKKLEFKNKEYNIPENTDEITLEQWDQIRWILEERENKEFITEKERIPIVVIATGIERDEIEYAPVHFYGFLLQELTWLFNLEPNTIPLQDYIEIDGQVYTYDKNEDLLLKEWGDIDLIVKEYPREDKFAGILAVRLRKELTKIVLDPETGLNTRVKYLEDYNSDVIEQRIAMFKKQPISKVLPIANFFLTKEQLLQNLEKKYSLMLATINLNHLQLRESMQNGDGTLRSSTFLTTHLYMKWTKYYNSELKKLLSIYPTSLMSAMPQVKI